jgi:hypothetical protein
MTEQAASTPKGMLAPGEVEPMPLSVFIPEKIKKRKRFFRRRGSATKTGEQKHPQASRPAAHD